MQVVNATLKTIQALVSAEIMAQHSFDQAATDRDVILCGLVSSIGYVPGVPASTEAIEAFADIRTAYVDAWEAQAKCARISAERQFQRACERAGIVKPQSGEAIKKQAAREAAKSAQQAAPAKGAKLPNAKAAPKAGAGNAAAAAALVALSAAENEIIRLIRAGEFALVHAAIKRLEPAAL